MDSKKATKATARVIGNRAYKNTEARLRGFLKEYARTGRVHASCEAVGIDFTVHYRRLQTDAVYRAAFDVAEQQAAQHLEDKVYDMAMQDELQAAIVLLKRFRPALYRERASLEVSGDISISEALSEARNRIITLEPHDRTGTEG